MQETNDHKKRNEIKSKEYLNVVLWRKLEMGKKKPTDNDNSAGTEAWF